MTRLAGTVVVTGGSRGIGRACADRLAAAGADLLLVARGEAELVATATELAARSGRRVAPLVADCSTREGAERLAAALEGCEDLLGLVHAAATLDAIGPALDVEADAWFEVVRVNLLGTLRTAQVVGRRLRRQARGGSMVLFSGGGGTSPFPNYTSYACGKAAVVRLAETLALELGEAGIRVNALAPGFVATRMHAATLAAGPAAAGGAYFERTRQELAGGGAPPEAAAEAALFLLAPVSAGITGRLLAAVHDDWRAWPAHAGQIAASDLFTVRRITPADRGLEWR
ncbi:MAG: SDR family oxidoreductase [Gemmatimonadales bacterium]|nr:SDR family oxidoreductase [Gemmatimonadales bacterium]